eukprot:Anaeramoba_ignava/a608630_16.p1 GENE.a608630_16~~a608630_16.p1  ORF type:complete len:150 (-),score=3.02 a608630_16:72-521(-)
MTMNTMNILIAEDHNMTARLLQNMIGNHDNMNVVDIAPTGQDVINKCDNNDVDVLLLDLEMPHMNGFQIMDELFAKKKNTKVLVLSAHTEGGVIEQSLQKGAAGYLTKKVDMDEIVEAITTVYNGDNYLCDTCLHSIVNSMKKSGSEML